MKNNKWLMATFTTSVIALIGFVYLFVQISNNKTAYIDLGQVFNEFELAKELNNKLTNTVQQRKTVIDSLELRLKLSYEKLQNGPINDDFKLMQRSYQIKKEAFEEQNQMQAEEYDGQIWKQLNTYVNEYAKAHKLDILLGGKGDGTLMYASANKDRTKEVIAFVNKKYRGL
jgi:outer membrane protein